MAYHVLHDGWNPRNWKRNINKDLHHPEPVMVQTENRAGRLETLDIEHVLCKQNIDALRHWIWAWLK